MGRRNKNVLWKENKKVRAYLAKANKSLFEDCFAGRFAYEVVDYRANSWDNGLGYPRWRFGSYRIRLVDNEEPERNVDYWVKWSDNFGLIEAYPADCVKGREYLANAGLQYLVMAMNNFIVKSDFWNLWHNDAEYKANHWYSGEELKRYEEFNDIRRENGAKA